MTTLFVHLVSDKTKRIKNRNEKANIKMKILNRQEEKLRVFRKTRYFFSKQRDDRYICSAYKM